MIHPSAIVDPGAEIDEGVEVGAYAIVGAGVQLGRGTRVGPHAVIEGPTRIGRENRVGSFSAIGGPPQDKKYGGEETVLEIGDRNTIREYCTFNRGTVQGGGATRIGDDNWIMAYVHVAHDCTVGSGTIMANGATLAGHVRVGDHAVLGAFTVVHQFCSIGSHAFSAMGTVVLKDVPPYVTVAGNSARAHGINAEGLRRAGFAPEVIRALRRAYKVVYRQGLTVQQAVTALGALARDCPEVLPLIEFLRTSERGIVR